MKLPDKLAAKMQAQVNRYKDASCWNEADAYSFGFQAGAAEVLAMAEKLAEALRDIDNQFDWYANKFKGWEDARHEFEHWWIVEVPSQMQQALADWEAWKGEE